MNFEEKNIRPICFPLEMIRNIDNKKTFRRPVRPQILECSQMYCCSESFTYDKIADNLYCTECGYPQFNNKDKEISPPYSIGDILYVKEPYSIDESGKVHYLVDDQKQKNVEWQVKGIMPKEYARTYFKITDIKCERLHDIFTKELPLKELTDEGILPMCSGCVFQGNDCNSNIINGNCRMKEVFIKLWNASLDSGERKNLNFEVNPLVWIFEIEKVIK